MKKQKKKTRSRVQPIYRTFAKLVAAERKACCMSQQQLAIKVKRSRDDIASIETGRQRVYLHDLLSFADAFCLDPADWLLILMGK